MIQNGTEATVEGRFQDIPDGGRHQKRNLDKRFGNMFTTGGRRYVYWMQKKDSQQIGDENQNITDQKLLTGNNINNVIDQSTFSSHNNPDNNTRYLNETSV